MYKLNLVLLPLKLTNYIFKIEDSITVFNQGTGNAGNLEINADTLFLNEGEISASTISGEGGNIFLNAENLELLDRSQISANAGGSGDGGNITIDSDTHSWYSKQ